MECEQCISGFSGDISGWDVSSVTNMGSMFSNSHIPEALICLINMPCSLDTRV